MKPIKTEYYELNHWFSSPGRFLWHQLYTLLRLIRDFLLNDAITQYL